MSANSPIEWCDHTDQAATGQRLSAYKSAATKTGNTLEDWLSKRAAGERWCFDCRMWKHHAEFSVDRSRKAGLNCRCRPCMSAASTASRYRTTSAEIARLAQAQDYRCLICVRQRKLVVDHDHATGAIRGLICNRCNVGMGQFEDDPALLRQAIAYLERNDG